MWHLYLIQNNKTLERYIGITTDIERRIGEHNQGLNKSTRRVNGLAQHQRDGAGEWILIYAESYRSKDDVVIRERKMKMYGKSKQELLKRCINSLIK